MQPPKTALRHTRNIAGANAPTRRFGRSTTVAAGVTLVVLASAAPALAINPGGGRHRVEAYRQAQLSQHASANAHTAADADSFLEQELYKLRMCESHNNYRANTGNGYYGAYQFALQTWEDLGLTGRPDQASPDVQDYAAKVLHARAGWGPWPACSASQHLT